MEFVGQLRLRHSSSSARRECGAGYAIRADEVYLTSAAAVGKSPNSDWHKGTFADADQIALLNCAASGHRYLSKAAAMTRMTARPASVTLSFMPSMSSSPSHCKGASSESSL